MSHVRSIVVLSALPVIAPAATAGDWVSFREETATRLVADPDVGVDDPDEKDYAWGDVDLDGDIDLVVVRKQPFLTTGRRTNVLFMNEDGVLVDRTATYATASDVPGDLGFLTPTNDRDVVLVDVTGDGLLDVVTATTMSDGLPKHIGHPRVYVNLGTGGDGAWLGFRYEDARIPQLYTAGGVAANPRFNAMAAGDVTGDGAPDLYFVDSDHGPPAEVDDLNDRLLVNDGTGFFVDLSSALMTPEMLESDFGTGVVIADVNGDGWNDVVKSAALPVPMSVSIAYHAPGVPAGFSAFDVVYTGAATSVSAGDLNGDGRVDLVVTDDGIDRYLLNLGNDAEGLATFTIHVLPLSSNGFGGGSMIVDLDGDGSTDVLVADVDGEIPGCSRRLGFYRNGGVSPTPTLVDDVPTGISDPDRTGTFDVAVFDLDGDADLDLVLGRCAGMRIWIQDPVIGDLNGDGAVGMADLLALLGLWGPCTPPPAACPGDLNGDGAVGFADLFVLLGNWGG